MRPTRKASITKNLLQIKEGTVEESHIKELLLDIRESVEYNSFTRELGDFIAHDMRQKGICHAEFDYRTFMFFNFSGVKIGSLEPGLKEDLVTLDKRVYDIIMGNGFKKAPEDAFKEGGYTKKQAKKAFEESYTFNKKTFKYILKDSDKHWLVNAIVRSILQFFNTDSMIHAGEVIDRLNSDVKKIAREHLRSLGYDDWILKQGNDIMVCIFALFQDVTFSLYNGKTGTFSLSGSRLSTPEVRDDNQTPVSRPEETTLYGQMPVKIPDGSADFLLATPFIEANIKLSDYMDVEWVETEQKVTEVTKEFNNVIAERDEHGRLRLIEVELED